MRDIIILVANYTVKYFIVLVAGMAAGYLNSVIINILLGEKTILGYWQALKNKNRQILKKKHRQILDNKSRQILDNENRLIFDNENRQILDNEKPEEKAGETREVLAVFTTAAVFILVFSKYGLTADFVFFAYLLSVLVIMVFIDIKTKTIPNGLVLAGLAGSAAVFAYNIFQPLRIYESDRWWYPLLGILPGSGILLLTAMFGAIIYRNEEVMGMGDVKIFAPIGIFLGWKMCALALIISMFLGGFASIVLIILSIKKRKDTIPFGPFIAIAVFTTIMWGQDIWSWYFSYL